MGIERVPTHRVNGKLCGSFVYMLLCQDAPGPVYVKVGLTDTPKRRLLALRAGCPVSPRQFLFCELRSRYRASVVERALLRAMKPWRAHGEWFHVPIEDKAKFNAAWGPAFAACYEPPWPMKWQRIAAKPFFREAEIRRREFLREYRSRGNSYRDFVAARGTCK